MNWDGSTITAEEVDCLTASPSALAEQFGPATPVESEWEFAAVERIAELEVLPANWDGHGSGAVSSTAATVAVELVHRISDLGVESLRPPFIGVSGGEGIVLEWDTPGGGLSFAVAADGKIEYLVSGQTEESGELAGKALARLRTLVAQLAQPS
jgi:hypothetical protein